MHTSLTFVAEGGAAERAIRKLDFAAATASDAADAISLATLQDLRMTVLHVTAASIFLHLLRRALLR